MASVSVQLTSGEEWSDDDVAQVVLTSARHALRRFKGYTTLDDLVQEAWLHVYSRPAKLEEWKGQGELGKRRLGNALVNACALYGHKEKAAALGFKVQDLFFYGLTTLRHVVPLILENGLRSDASVYADFPDREVWMDVCNALNELSESDYQIIWWMFRGDPEEGCGYATVSGKLGITESGARKRVDRILRRMQTYLGGPNAVPRRTRKSNAQAMAETRSVWDGQG